MYSFYGDVTCSMPCVICDAGMHVLFANRTAHREAVTAGWIAEGKTNFEAKVTEALEKAFAADPFGIARLDINRGGAHYAVLADRISVASATVYALALIRHSDAEADRLPLPTELEGRRMLTACFSPELCGSGSDIPFNGELTMLWTNIASRAAENVGKHVDVISKISAVGSPIKGCYSLIGCATAVLAAFCKNARRNIGVLWREDELYTSVSFSAETETQLGAELIGADSAPLIAACFPDATLPILIAVQMAVSAGISISADTVGRNGVRVTLRAPRFDVGDCGFKAPSDLIGNAKTVIYAVAEMLI